MLIFIFITAYIFLFVCLYDLFNIQKRLTRNVKRLSRKLRDTWIAGKFGFVVQNEAGQRIRKFFFYLFIYFYFTILYWFCHTSTWICNENILVIANTLFQQHKRRLYKCTSIPKSDWLYSLQPKMEKFYIVS